VERLCRGTSSWRRLAERRWRREAKSEMGVHQKCSSLIFGFLSIGLPGIFFWQLESEVTFLTSAESLVRCYNIGLVLKARVRPCTMLLLTDFVCIENPTKVMSLIESYVSLQIDVSLSTNGRHQLIRSKSSSWRSCSQNVQHHFNFHHDLLCDQCTIHITGAPVSSSTWSCSLSRH